MAKLLSIIIPTYNMEEYLRRCLDSLILENEDDCQLLDIIIINDGSTDSSSCIGHEYENRFPNVFRVIDKENGHYGSCVNRGLKEAEGKYVRVLDADDYLDCNIFPVFLRALSEADSDVFISDYKKVNEEGMVKRNVHFKGLVEKKKSVVTSMFANMRMQTHAVAYRTELLKRIDYRQSEGLLYTDQEWMFLPFANCKSYYYLPNLPLYNYLLGRKGQSVDRKVHCKHIGDEVKGLYVMIDQYLDNREKLDEIGRKYLEGRLRRRMRVIYSSYLLRYYLVLSRRDLISIDEYIKLKSEHIYRLADEITMNNRFFVKEWRKHYRVSFGIWTIRLCLWYREDSENWIIMLMKRAIRKTIRMVRNRVTSYS